MEIVNKPDLNVKAGQFRKPAGKMAEQIAAKMNHLELICEKKRPSSSIKI